MTPISYMILLTTSHQSAELTLKILNTAGRGYAFYGETNGNGTSEFWIIQKGKNNQQEVTTQLQRVPSIRSVSVVALSRPVTSTELIQIRKLFAVVGWDTTSVSEEELALFVNGELQGKNAYFIEFVPKERSNAPVKINIRRIEEHPHFSPEWLKEQDSAQEEIEDRELTMDDLEICSVVVQSVEHEPLPPPPPPPSVPGNPNEMTDE
ncbi:hypothetical protein V9K67_22605 [Paraflavisolibacter sp. H34]|uniref:hypothetical protein n=1 Tax=Huijunlia imazamoxiresistens TaxID=3127457 RepID=UPI003015DEF0